MGLVHTWVCRYGEQHIWGFEMSSWAHRFTLSHYSNWIEKDWKCLECWYDPCQHPKYYRQHVGSFCNLDWTLFKGLSKCQSSNFVKPQLRLLGKVTAAIEWYNFFPHACSCSMVTSLTQCYTRVSVGNKSHQSLEIDMPKAMSWLTLNTSDQKGAQHCITSDVFEVLSYSHNSLGKLKLEVRFGSPGQSNCRHVS